MKNRDLPEIPKNLDTKKPDQKIKKPAKKSWFAKNTWLVFVVGFLFIPAFVRWLFNGLIPSAVQKYWQLGQLGQATKEAAEVSRMFAEFYARISFNLTFLVFIGLLLVAVIVIDKAKVESWGLHLKYILPALLYFTGFWIIIYYFFVPVGSILSGGESYYIGLPTPTGLQDAGNISSTSLWSTLKYMFFPKSVVAFVISGGTVMVPGAESPAFGWLDFIRLWLLNGPILMFGTLGYFFNKLLNWFKTPGWTPGAKRDEDEILHPGFKYVVALIFSITLVPVMKALYRVMDKSLSYMTVQVEGAEVQKTIYATATSNVVWMVVFWLVIAIAFNLAFNWAFVKRVKRELSDWESSLYKWLPGFIVFVVGMIFAWMAGWQLAPVNPETGALVTSAFGPFTAIDFAGFFYLLICAYTYIRTRNLIIPALIFTSLPFFLTFIRITKGVVPTVTGSWIAGILTMIILIAFTETYRFWAPWVTFEIKYEEESDAGEVKELEK